jgi:hypothetical protein
VIYNATLNGKQQCSRELATSDFEVVQKTAFTLKMGGSKLLKNDGIYFLSGRASFSRRPEHSSTMMEELALFGFK